MDQLPTRSELARRIKECEKQGKKVSAAHVIIGFVLALSGLGITFAVLPHDRSEPRLVPVIPAAAGIIMMMLLIIRSERVSLKLPAHTGNICPHCNQPLTHINGKLALTTGRCASCGELVISDP